MIDFNQAKQKVAERHGYSEWLTLVNRNTSAYREEKLEEVCRLMCNEAVKADRELVKRKCVYYKKENILFDLQTFQVLPLPFPEP